MSWGTKGSDKAEALPSVSSKPKGGEAVVEDQAHVQADVDANFRETVTRAMTRIETKEVREKPTMDDENKTFRTRLVAMWMVTNAGLAFAIESGSGVSSTTSELQSRQSTYFAIILYSTFGLSLVRFIGVRFLSYQFNVGISLKKLNLVCLLLHHPKPVSMLPQELVDLVLSWS